MNEGPGVLGAMNRVWKGYEMRMMYEIYWCRLYYIELRIGVLVTREKNEINTKCVENLLFKENV